MNIIGVIAIKTRVLTQLGKLTANVETSQQDAEELLLQAHQLFIYYSKEMSQEVVSGWQTTWSAEPITKQLEHLFSYTICYGDVIISMLACVYIFTWWLWCVKWMLHLVIWVPLFYILSFLELCRLLGFSDYHHLNMVILFWFDELLLYGLFYQFLAPLDVAVHALCDVNVWIILNTWTFQYFS